MKIGGIFFALKMSVREKKRKREKRLKGKERDK
jgi:hypothetical protein